MSRVNDRQPSLFFGERTSTHQSKSEHAAFTSASAVGARVAANYFGWAEHAREVLKHQLSEWSGKQPTVPDGMDTEYLEHSWHLICLVGHGLPRYTPQVGCELTVLGSCL